MECERNSGDAVAIKWIVNIELELDGNEFWVSFWIYGLNYLEMVRP